MITCFPVARMPIALVVMASATLFPSITPLQRTRATNRSYQ